MTAGTKLAHSGKSGILFKSIYAGERQICGAAAVSRSVKSASPIFLRDKPPITAASSSVLPSNVQCPCTVDCHEQLLEDCGGRNARVYVAPRLNLHPVS